MKTWVGRSRGQRRRLAWVRKVGIICVKVLAGAMDRHEIAGLRASFSKTRVFYFITVQFKNPSYCLYHAIHIGSLYINSCPRRNNIV